MSDDDDSDTERPVDVKRINAIVEVRHAVYHPSLLGVMNLPGGYCFASWSGDVASAGWVTKPRLPAPLIP